ncbi:MAG: peptidylprolyl isomerase [bacterium]|nr:peptidylprolyl isomerase [bacterium]
MGTMAFRFFEADAPVSCTHIQKLVGEGFYDGKDFYRIVKGHVIQAGGGGENIPDEFNENKHVFGAVGIAHGNEANSGGSSFYICLSPREHLDGLYTVFGELVEGEDVLKAIENVKVIEKFSESGVAFHEPEVPVTIEKAYIELRPVNR